MYIAASLLGLLVSLFIAWRLYKNNFLFVRFNVGLNTFFDSIFFFLISFAIGARVLYIMEHWEKFSASLFSWFLFLHVPGFSFLGGVIGGFLGLFLFCQAKKLPYLLLADLLSVAVAFVLACFRIGAALSGNSPGVKIFGMRQPVYLYEAVLSFVIFLFLHWLYVRGKSVNGEITLYFFLLIGITGFLVESFRTDSIYLGGFAIFICLAVACLLLLHRALVKEYFIHAKRMVRTLTKKENR